MATISNTNQFENLVNQYGSLAGGYIANTSTTDYSGTDYTQLQQAYRNAAIQGQGWYQAQYPVNNYPITAVLKFFRLNNMVEHIEGQRLAEPLDELRIKVAKWLRR